VFCPFVDEQHQFCCSRPWHPTELRMALQGEVLDLYINALVSYINSSTIMQGNNNNNNNNKSVATRIGGNINSHTSSTSGSDSSPIETIIVPSLPIDDVKPLSPSIIQDLVETLNITCPRCNAVLDPTPDGCCSVR